MLYQTLTLAANASVVMQAQGQALWYESSSIVGENRIKVRASGGDDIILKPGQSVRFENPSQQWTITSMGGAGALNVIIGSGEFADNNTTIAGGTMQVTNFPATQQVAGTVALDAATLNALEFTSVSVNNFPATQQVAGTVSISATAAAPLPVRETQTAVTGHYLVTGTQAAGAVAIVAPAVNVNGIIVHGYHLESDPTANPNCYYTLVAKNAAPASYTDGVVVDFVINRNGVTRERATPVLIPPGLGLYLSYQFALSTAGAVRRVLYTVL